MDPAPLSWLNALIERQGLFVALPAVFAGGLALNLTPCVYPMLPVTLAFFSQQAGGARKYLIQLGGCYLAGISVSYAILGLFAAKTGALFGSWLQLPIVLIGIALAVISLALSMFGLYEITLPRAISDRIGAAGTGRRGALMMGVMVGFVAAPCVGPFLVGLLLLVTQMANPAAGFLLFFVLGLGMGLPSLLLSMLAGRASRLPRAGAWLVWVKHGLGFVLIGLALFFTKSLLPDAAVRWLTVLLCLAAAVWLGWLGVPEAKGKAFVPVRRVSGLVLGAAAFFMLVPRAPHAAPLVPWVPYQEAVLEQSLRDGKRVLVDVYADWCLPCVEMDHVTFRHPDVVKALSNVVTLRVDATREITPDAEQLLGKYRVYGAPTVLFFDRTGRERTELRLTGFVKPDEFLERLAQTEAPVAPSK